MGFSTSIDVPGTELMSIEVHRAVSHVRKEIHRLRTVSKVNLSVPTRQLLGLDIVESSNKALDRLQIDHTRSQDALQIALAESKQIGISFHSSFQVRIDTSTQQSQMEGYSNVYWIISCSLHDSRTKSRVVVDRKFKSMVSSSYCSPILKLATQ